MKGWRCFVFLKCKCYKFLFSKSLKLGSGVTKSPYPDRQPFGSDGFGQSGFINQRYGSGSFHHQAIAMQNNEKKPLFLLFSDFFLTVFPVWRIRDVYPGSRILIFTHPGSRISDPGSRIPNPKTVTKERGEKNLLSYFPGVKKAPDPGSGSATLCLSLNNYVNVPSKSSKQKKINK